MKCGRCGRSNGVEAYQIVPVGGMAEERPQVGLCIPCVIAIEDASSGKSLQVRLKGKDRPAARRDRRRPS